MADRGIKLKRSEITNANHHYLRGFRIRIEVDDTVGDVPREIFVYRRHDADGNGNILDEFQTVASLPDLAEYPVNDPDPDRNLPFFRKDFIELDVRAMSHAEEVWRIVSDCAVTLIGQMNKAEQLTVTQEIWIGDIPASDSVSTSA